MSGDRSREEVRRAGGLSDVGDDVEAVESQPLVVEAVPRANVEVKGPTRTTVPMPGPGTPRVVLFDLRADHLGDGELWIIVSQGQVPRSTLALRTRIVDAPTGGGAPSAGQASVDVGSRSMAAHRCRPGHVPSTDGPPADDFL